MLTFFDLPLEIRNVIYRLTLQGARLKFHLTDISNPPDAPFGRAALLQVSRKCNIEALDILFRHVELNITPLISFPSSPSSKLSSVTHKLRHAVLDGRTGEFDDGSFISTIPNLTSLTLLCECGYELILYDDRQGFGVNMNRQPLIDGIRGSPWKVLSSKFWIPRKDLEGFLSVWKARGKGFSLKTEVFVSIFRNSSWSESYTARFDMGTKIMTILQKRSDGMMAEICDFPLELRDPRPIFAKIMGDVMDADR